MSQARERALPEDTLVVASQIGELAGRRALHTAEVVKAASEGGPERGFPATAPGKNGQR